MFIFFGQKICTRPNFIFFFGPLYICSAKPYFSLSQPYSAKKTSLYQKIALKNAHSIKKQPRQKRCSIKSYSRNRRFLVIFQVGTTVSISIRWWHLLLILIALLILYKWHAMDRKLLCRKNSSVRKTMILAKNIDIGTLYTPHTIISYTSLTSSNGC